jgi:hypothetical protein
VADGVPQDSWRIALDEDGFQPQARNLHLSNGASLNRRMWYFNVAYFSNFDCSIV